MKYGLDSFRKDFSTEEECLGYVFNKLYGPRCSCGGRYAKVRNRRQYQCSRCRHQIAPTAGTIFHKSPTPLTLWFHAIFIFCHARSGISAKEMQRQLGVTYKCAYRMLSLIKHRVRQGEGKLQGIVDIDTGQFSEKSSVILAVERNGPIRARVVRKTDAVTVQAFIHDMVEKKVAYTTRMNAGDPFFFNFKRSIKGTFKNVSDAKLQAYLNAFVFRYNHRHDDKQRFEALCESLVRPKSVV